jgi:hypothetical protein
MQSHVSSPYGQCCPTVWVDVYGVDGEGRPRFLVLTPSQSTGGPWDAVACDADALGCLTAGFQAPSGRVVYSKDARAVLASDGEACEGRTLPACPGS